MLKKDFSWWLAACLISGTVAFYYSITELWWMFDDSQHLKLVSHYGLKVFTHPAAEAGYIPANFTPWLFLNYWIDYQLTGLDPQGAYIHQLVSMALVASAVFMLARKIMGPWFAAVLVLCFFMSPVMSTLMHILCTRHYLEGLGYSCISILLFIHWQEQRKIWLLIISALCYAIAALNKEVYVPLIGIFASLIFLDFIKQYQWRVWKSLTPYMMVATGYIFYRAYALGWNRLITGYGDQSEHKGLQEIFYYLWEVANYNKMLLVILAVVVFSAVRIVRDYKNKQLEKDVFVRFLLFAACCVICTLLPVYKVMHTADVNHNYIFVATFTVWFGLVYLVFILCSEKPDKKYIVLAVIALGSFVFYQVKHAIPGTYLMSYSQQNNLFERYKTEGRFILYQTESVQLLQPVGAPWHHSGLYDLRRQVLGQSTGPVACSDICRCDPDLPVYTWSENQIFPADLAGISCTENKVVSQ